MTDPHCLIPWTQWRSSSGEQQQQQRCPAAATTVTTGTAAQIAKQGPALCTVSSQLIQQQLTQVECCSSSSSVWIVQVHNSIMALHIIS